MKERKDQPRKGHRTKHALILFVFFLLTADSNASILFPDVKTTPGYLNRAREPWASWEREISIDASSPDYPHIAALYYQITGDMSYLNMATNRLKTFQTDSYDLNRGKDLLNLCLAYDWVKPSLSSSDDAFIRDRLARLADTVYHDLSVHDDGELDPVDYHSQVIPGVAVAGLVLSDYSKALPYASTPSKWLAAGTSDMFVLDSIHPSTHKPYVEAEWDREGKDLLGGYEVYYVGAFAVWFQIYSYYYNRSIASVYPMAAKFINARIWDTLPNGYMSNFVTEGNTKRIGFQSMLNLVDPENQSNLLRVYDLVSSDDSLPYTRTWDNVPSYLYYLTYQDYSAVRRTSPAWTSHLSKDSVFQTMRKDWTKTSAWASFTTWNVSTAYARNMAHNDQLNFEYYDRGDYVVADSGEVKYRETGYGPTTAKGHNVLMVSNNASGNVGGVVKGTTDRLETPAPLQEALTSDFLDYAGSQLVWNKIENTDLDGEPTGGEDITLSSPVTWRRSLLFPGKDYLIVFDSVDSSQMRKIYSLYHMTSFQHGETMGSTIGNVRGNLSVGRTSVDWMSQKFGSEVNIGTGSELRWNTTSIDGRAITTQLYTIPSSQISVENTGQG